MLVYHSYFSLCYLEEKVIKPLINDNAIKFYARYEDDTLFAIKREDVRCMHDFLNNLNPSLHFKVDISRWHMNL